MQKLPIPRFTIFFHPLPESIRQVYQQIEKAGDRGAWSKSLKDQTKLQQHTITKAPADAMRPKGGEKWKA